MQNYLSFYPPKSAAKPATTLVFVRPDQVQAGKLAGGEKNRNAVIRLSESVKRYGVLQPISVRYLGGEGEEAFYELIAGTKRWQAALIAGVEKIPCIILPQDDRTCAVAGILANLRESGVNMFEQAAAFRMLMQDFSLTQEEIARKMNLSQSAVANKLRLLKLTKEEQATILSANLTERHARALLRLPAGEARADAIRRIRIGKLNVASTERLIEEYIASKGLPAEQKNSPRAAFFGPDKQDLSPGVDQPQGGENARVAGVSPVTVTLSPQKPPSGVMPRKFAMQNLTPLYNSIERTLSIFRKTGSEVECRREEREDSVCIVIRIPKRA